MQTDPALPAVDALFAEGHVVQTAQATFWGLSAVVALSTANQRPRPLDRAIAGWQGALALLALARELDLHELIHTATPVHFRLRWLLESSDSLGWKGGVVALVLLTCLVVLAPPFVLRVPWRALWRRRDREIRLFVVALVCLAGGYLLDDIVGRWARVDRAHTKIVEEMLELVGAVAFWMFVEGERARPLTTRGIN